MRIHVLLAAAFVAFTTSDAWAQRNRTTCGPDVPLVVTVTGTQPGPGGFSIVSDGLGAYRDGTKGAAKVTAIFQVDNCTHDFTMNLSNSTRSMWALLSPGDMRAWFFNLDRVHSVPVTPSDAAGSAAFVASHPFCVGGVQRDATGAIRSDSAGWYYDNYGGCGVDDVGQAFVRRGGGFSLDPDDRLSFRVSPIDRPAQACVVGSSEPECFVSFLRVYHPDENTWIVRPEPPATAAHRAWQNGAAGYVLVGYETAPFEIAAVRK
jgi:hypothetical protein